MSFFLLLQYHRFVSPKQTAHAEKHRSAEVVVRIGGFAVSSGKPSSTLRDTLCDLDLPAKAPSEVINPPVP